VAPARGRSVRVARHTVEPPGGGRSPAAVLHRAWGVGRGTVGEKAYDGGADMHGVYRLARVAVAGLWLAGCGGGPAGGGGAGGSGGGTTGAASTGGSTGAGPPSSVGPFADGCEGAPVLGPGVYTGSLAGAAPSLPDGAGCGFGGPDRFAAVEVPVRADVLAYAVGEGFVPSLRWLQGACAVAPVQPAECSQGWPLWRLDVPAGAPLAIAVGGPADLGPGAGAFRLEITVRPVVPAGTPCGGAPAVRCEPGTVCDLAADVPVCVPLEGDVCAAPVEVDLAAAASEVLTFDWSKGFADAHRGACGPARRRDAVVSVRGPAEAGLRVAAPGAGLVVRRPTCLAADEVACGDGEVILPAAEAPFAGGEAVFVVVEGPAVGETAPPQSVVVERLDP